MKLQYPQIILISALFICFSCRKDREVAKYKGDYSITGKVIDEITGKGIAQANVGVIERDRDATSHLGGKTVAFDKSDADGNFTLTFDANTENYNYELSANALTYFTMTFGDDITFTKNGKKAQNITLLPYGYLSLHIKGNKGGYKLSVSAGGGGSNYYQNVDSVKTYYKTPDEQYRLIYGVFDQNDQLIHKIDTQLYIVLPPDSTHYLIEF